MTTLRFPVAALFICLLICSGCKEQSTAVQLVSTNASFTLDGDGFDERLVSISNATAIGYYSQSLFQTLCGVTSIAGDTLLSINFSFRGTQPDTFYFSGLPPMNPATFSVTIDGKVYSALSGTLIVTDYSAVGGTIRGTFSGTLSEILPEPTEVRITNGVFSVRRREDQP